MEKQEHCCKLKISQREYQMNRKGLADMMQTTEVAYFPKVSDVRTAGCRLEDHV
jgi:hypothetical protein